jgi:hypothetical protein
VLIEKLGIDLWSHIKPARDAMKKVVPAGMAETVAVKEMGGCPLGRAGPGWTGREAYPTGL